MKQFLGDYSRKIYGRELIDKVNISQKNIALTLDKLEQVGIVSSEIRGNTRYFFLNKKNPICRKYILLAEIENSIRFLEKHQKLVQIFNKIKTTDSRFICIFGSYAKGNERKDSDLDLFVVGGIDESKLKKLGRDYNLEINVKEGSVSDFVKLLESKNPLINEILEHHIIISGYEKFIEIVTGEKW
jgi:predicted nucleotidyltransferase|tara:strand:- start:4967 stop:5524 length:558 start_codon:yes stop_codon:yes gene_type:complete